MDAQSPHRRMNKASVLLAGSVFLRIRRPDLIEAVWQRSAVNAGPSLELCYTLIGLNSGIAALDRSAFKMHELLCIFTVVVEILSRGSK